MRALVLSSLAVLAVTADVRAREWEPAAPAECGSWVSVQVEVDGRAMPLYSSPDGTRRYVEARAGGRYELKIENRTGQRLGVKVAVDGLNVISGERDHTGPDRMYVLGPWEQTAIRGWRTSLESVRRFTFIDEKSSYAARSGKANGKMGWIELAVYPERRPVIVSEEDDRRRNERFDGAKDEQGAARDRAADASGARPAEAPSAKAQSAPAPGRSFPGTGWGDPAQDQVRLVQFDPAPTPVENVTVRYEYRAALQALGLIPRWEPRDRLSQRERGDGGFAKAPLW
jgi:hypothetical protein